MGERRERTRTAGPVRWAAAVGTLALMAGSMAGCGSTEHPPPVTSGAPAPGTSSAAASDWRVTVYYTPVEEFHGGEPVAVTGHSTLTGEDEVDLGDYPAEFVEIVREEGCGRISSGPHAGMYLNWSWDTGFWLDTSTRDTAGDPLVPFETAAVDGVERGTRLRLADCGENDDGTPVDPAPCARLRDAEWVVRDEFTPGFGGERHVDLYIGEEDRHGFTDSELWVAWSEAEVVLEPGG